MQQQATRSLSARGAGGATRDARAVGERSEGSKNVPTERLGKLLKERDELLGRLRGIERDKDDALEALEAYKQAFEQQLMKTKLERF